MVRDMGGPSPEEMGVEDKLNSPWKNPKVEQALSLANQSGGFNRVKPEEMEAIIGAMEAVKATADPALLDAVHPDNERNMKHLSPQARDYLRRGWEAVMGGETDKGAGAK